MPSIRIVQDADAPKQGPERYPVLSDSELIEYLSQRTYVEATDMGNEDPNRFEFHAMGRRSFRQALSAHIQRKHK